MGKFTINNNYYKTVYRKDGNKRKRLLSYTHNVQGTCTCIYVHMYTCIYVYGYAFDSRTRMLGLAGQEEMYICTFYLHVHCTIGTFTTSTDSPKYILCV